MKPTTTNQQPDYTGLAKLLFLPDRWPGLWDSLVVRRYPPFYLHIYLDSPRMSVAVKSQRDIAMSEGAPRIGPTYAAMPLRNWVQCNYLFHTLHQRSYLRHFKPLSATKVAGSLRSGHAVFDLSGSRAQKALQQDLMRLQAVQERLAGEDGWMFMPEDAFNYLNEFDVAECHNVASILASLAMQFIRVALQVPLARSVFVISPAARINSIRPLGR